MRSFRAEQVSGFVKALLDGDEASARTCLHSFRSRYPMVVTSISMWLIRLPVAWFFVEVMHWGLPGAFLGFVVGSTIEATAEYLRYRAGKWKGLQV